MAVLRRGWVEVVCPVHGFICEAPQTADVYCQKCDRWVRIVKTERAR